MKTRNRIITAFALFALTTAILLPLHFCSRTVSASATKPTEISVVVAGLHGPRGLKFGPGNILYIAEAGDESHTGSIIQVLNAMSQNAAAHTIVDDLPTTGGDGEFLGVHDLSVLGHGSNTSIYAIMGLSPQATGNNAFGNLFRVDTAPLLLTGDSLHFFMFCRVR